MKLLKKSFHMDLEEKKMADKSQREKDKKSKQKVSKGKKKDDGPNYLKRFDVKISKKVKK